MISRSEAKLRGREQVSKHVGIFRSGSVSVEDLKAMCKKFGIPIDDGQIQGLLRE